MKTAAENPQGPGAGRAEKVKDAAQDPISPQDRSVENMPQTLLHTLCFLFTGQDWNVFLWERGQWPNVMKEYFGTQFNENGCRRN